MVEEGLRAAGVQRVVVIAETHGFLDRLARLDPDVIVIDHENPSRDLLEQMFQVSRLIVSLPPLGGGRHDGEDMMLEIARAKRGRAGSSPCPCSC